MLFSKGKKFIYSDSLLISFRLKRINKIHLAFDETLLQDHTYFSAKNMKAIRCIKTGAVCPLNDFISLFEYILN